MKTRRKFLNEREFLDQPPGSVFGATVIDQDYDYIVMVGKVRRVLTSNTSAGWDLIDFNWKAYEKRDE